MNAMHHNMNQRGLQVLSFSCLRISLHIGLRIYLRASMRDAANVMTT